MAYEMKHGYLQLHIFCAALMYFVIHFFQKLHSELPLSAEELENVFDSLDSDRNGYLTLGEFSSGFSEFAYRL